MKRALFSLPVVVLLAWNSCATDARGVELARLAAANWDEFVPTGKEVDAIYGDWVLRNDAVIAVIADTVDGRNANMTTRDVGGGVIDLTLRKQPNDQLSAYYPELGRKLRVTSLRANSLDRWNAGSANREPPPEDLLVTASRIVLVLEADAQENQPGVRVEYTLTDSSAGALRVETIYSNSGQQPQEIVPRDKIRADVGFDFGWDEQLTLLWAHDSWWGQAYGIVAEGAELLTSAEQLKKSPPTRGYEWSYSLPGLTDGQLLPGESVSLVRYLWAAEDSLGLKRARCEQAGKDLNTAAVRVADPQGPVAGARVDVLIGEEVYGSGRTAPDGAFQASAPGAGKCRLRIVPPGRTASETEVDLRAIGPGGQTIPLPDPASVVARITAEDGAGVPCKVGFSGKDGTPDPVFGPNTRIYGVQNLWYTPNGDFRLSVEPGRYDVVISHGPEFDAVLREVDLRSGEQFDLRAQLVRSVDTAGWLSAELHSHSSPSGDNTSSQRGRVLNLLAEHLEFIPCTEHNRISVYDPHLDFFGAAGRVLTCPGMELTGQLLPINHQNAFPLVHHPRTQDGGGPLVDSNPEVQIERLALWDDRSDKLVQSDHPNLVQMYGDRDMDGNADAGFRKMFGFMDVVEIHPLEKIFTPPAALTTTSNDRGNAVFHWLQLLNLGYRISGVVNTDAHYNFHGSGPLRNFIQSTTDEPAEARVLDLCHAAEQGRLTMTNGPFLEVSARDSGSTGQPVTVGEDLASGGEVLLSVGVQCANWLDVNRVQVFVNGRPDEQLNFTRRTHRQMFADGVKKFDAEIPVRVDSDAHLIVVAAGEGLQVGRVMGPAAGKNMPIAVSNPVFVDVDGRGFQANGDMLGLPLPMQQSE